MGGKLSEQEYDELLEMIRKYGALVRDSGLSWTEGTAQFALIVKWVASRTDFGFSRESSEADLPTDTA